MKKIDLTEGKVIKVITALALPIMGSSLLQFTYNLVDMLWVGGLGSDAVASIGSSSLYIGLGYSINALVVIGAGIKVAHGIGESDHNKVKEYINAGIFINILMGLIFGFVLIFMGKEFIGFLNIKNAYVEREAYHYLALNSPILFFTFFNVLYARILGSFGNNKLAFKINALGLIINIILDPIFIYWFKIGVLGAAIATLIASIVMFCMYLIKASDILKFNFRIGIDKNKIIEIIKLGFPMTFQRILFTIINIILAKIVASFGSDAIAGQKIGLEIESVMYMVIGGLNGAVSSFTGQNFGAKKFNRIKEGYNEALKIGMIYSLIIGLAFLFLNKHLIRLFISEENTIIIAAAYLQVVAFSQIFSTLEMVSNGLFTGIGKPNIPATISVVFTVLRIPISLVLVKPFGVNGIWITIALSSIFKGMTSYLLYRIKVKRKYM